MKIKYIILLLLFTVIGSGSLPAKDIIVKDSILGLGAIYTNKIMTSTGSRKHSVHIIEVSRMIPQNFIKVLKAKDNNSELEKLHDIVSSYNNDNYEILGAVNANFWRAYSNFPIGPTVIDGEVLQMHRHKQWSSIFFDKLNSPVIDTFDISGKIIYGKDSMQIDFTNRRKDSTGIVVYNKYGGETIPYIKSSVISDAFEQAVKENEFDESIADSTEEGLDYDEFRDNLISEKQASMTEFAMKKIVVEYLEIPTVNSPVRCVVRQETEGTVNMPENGCIISFGADIPAYKIPILNDTIQILYQTNIMKKTVFFNSVSGTPRLVRKGKDRHEAIAEGSKGRRFIRHRLPRTAIGFSRDKSKVFIVTVEQGNRKNKTNGANLTELARIMKKLGCYEAMNLDGGGSSIMLINNCNVMKSERPDYSRKLSVGLGVARKKE
jgi:exopolysaccharide biosynthesis protein